MVYNGKPYYIGWFGGTPIFGNTYRLKKDKWIKSTGLNLSVFETSSREDEACQWTLDAQTLKHLSLSLDVFSINKFFCTHVTVSLWLSHVWTGFNQPRISEALDILLYGRFIPFWYSILGKLWKPDLTEQHTWQSSFAMPSHMIVVQA